MGGLTVRSLAMDIVISSSTSLTSASASSFIAGGPTGMSIMVNQSAGSLVKRLVELARNQITGMLVLHSVSFGLHRPWRARP